LLSEYNLKAVVFDDEKGEAEPIIDALNSERIPNIFLTFEPNESEDKKIKNIRLVFADLIFGSSVSGNIDSLVEPVKNAIITNISEDNGLFILIIWSKHSTHADALKRRLNEASNLNFEMVTLDKNEYMIKNGDKYELKDVNSFESLKEHISERLNSLEYIRIFLEWERDARDSISKVLTIFIENVSEREEVKNTISSAIKLTLGKKNDATTAEKIKSFYQTLNTILADSIVNNSNPIEQHEDFLNTLDLETIDDNMKAEINRKTLFENPVDNELKTGNIYSFEDFKDLFYGDVIKDVCGCDYENILESDLFRYTKKCKFFDKEAAEADSVHQKRHYLKMEEMAFPILFEFTPSCDIANNKYQKSRLIFGYMINSQYACMENKSESLYITDFHFQYKDVARELDGNYRLAFFIKNIFAVNPEKVKELTPMIRARKEFATDLQHTIANHISRIGISSLDL
jgi:hypothetical protein